MDCQRSLFYEKINLKAKIEFESDQEHMTTITLKNCPIRSEAALDPVTLHNLSVLKYGCSTQTNAYFKIESNEVLERLKFLSNANAVDEASLNLMNMLLYKGVGYFFFIVVF